MLTRRRKWKVPFAFGRIIDPDFDAIEYLDIEERSTASLITSAQIGHDATVYDHPPTEDEHLHIPGFAEQVKWIEQERKLNEERQEQWALREAIRNWQKQVREDEEASKPETRPLEWDEAQHALANLAQKKRQQKLIREQERVARLQAKRAWLRNTHRTREDVNPFKIGDTVRSIMTKRTYTITNILLGENGKPYLELVQVPGDNQIIGYPTSFRLVQSKGEK